MELVLIYSLIVFTAGQWLPGNFWDSGDCRPCSQLHESCTCDHFEGCVCHWPNIRSGARSTSQKWYCEDDENVTLTGLCDCELSEDCSNEDCDIGLYYVGTGWATCHADCLSCNGPNYNDCTSWEELDSLIYGGVWKNYFELLVIEQYEVDEDNESDIRAFLNGLSYPIVEQVVLQASFDDFMQLLWQQARIQLADDEEGDQDNGSQSSSDNKSSDDDSSDDEGGWGFRCFMTIISVWVPVVGGAIVCICWKLQRHRDYIRRLKKEAKSAPPKENDTEMGETAITEEFRSKLEIKRPYSVVPNSRPAFDPTTDRLEKAQPNRGHPVQHAVAVPQQADMGVNIAIYHIPAPLSQHIQTYPQPEGAYVPQPGQPAVLNPSQPPVQTSPRNDHVASPTNSVQLQDEVAEESEECQVGVSQSPVPAELSATQDETAITEIEEQPYKYQTLKRRDKNDNL